MQREIGNDAKSRDAISNLSARKEAEIESSLKEFILQDISQEIKRIEDILFINNIKYG